MERGCWEEGRVENREQEDVRQMERGDSAERKRDREKERKQKMERGRFVFN